MTRYGHTLALLGTLACSTLAPVPASQECTDDVDCTNAGEVCAPDTRICVPALELAPRAVLGFDVQELEGGVTVFRAEVDGCDREVKASSANNELSISRNELLQSLELSVYTAASPPDEPDPSTPLPGEIEITQTSRFNRQGPVRRQLTYPNIEGAGDSTQIAPTTVRWPRYHPFDRVPRELEGGGFLLWRFRPEAGAGVVQMLAPPETLASVPCDSDKDCCGDDGDCTRNPNFCMPQVGQCTAIGNPRFSYELAYDDRCNRELTGEVWRIDDQARLLAPLPSSAVNFRYADTPDDPRLGLFAVGSVAPADRPVQCDGDEDCVSSEQFCDGLTGQCMLAMAGRRTDTNSVTADDQGMFATNIYTYCQTDPANIGLRRSFTGSVAPPGPLPAVNFELTAQFAPVMDSDKPVTRLTKKLCVPDWGPAVTAKIILRGAPQAVVEGPRGAIQCCDVACLPHSADAAEQPGIVPPPQSCTGATLAGAVATADVATPLVLSKEALQAWEASQCHLPQVDDQGHAGEFRPAPVKCSLENASQCLFKDLAGTSAAPLTYRLRIESPVGSVVGSVSTELTIAPDSPEAELLVDLPPRVMVTGTVRLQQDLCTQVLPGTDCGASNAVILVERLRMPDDDQQGVVGPFFHELRTFYDPLHEIEGRYAVPLDPGVYVITALPGPGSPGGPADLRVLDLRDGRDVDDLDLELQPGVLVTLNVNSFDARAQIVPLDRGSWRDLVDPGRASDPDPSRRLLDLNDPAQCHGSAGEGCRIRRLVAGVLLTPGQVGDVRFLARQSPGAASCRF